MKRAVVHALCIVALAGLGWWIHLSTDYPFPGPLAPDFREAAVVGAWKWIPGAAGSAGLLLCAVACFFASKRRGTWLLLIPIVPVGILGLAALGYHGEVRDLVVGFGTPEVRSRGYQSMSWWLSANAYAVQLVLARGILWTWLAYLAVAAAAACTPAPRREGDVTFRWAWPATTATALAGLLLVYVLCHAGVFFRLLHARHLDPWGQLGAAAKGLVDPQSLAIQSPFLASLAILVVLTSLLLPLWPRVADLAGRSTPHAREARAVAGVAVFGACVTQGLAFWSMASARLMLNFHVALIASTASAKQAVLGLWGLHSPFKDYRAGAPICIALLVTAVVIAGPLLVPSLRARRALVSSTLLLALALAVFAGVRSSAFLQLSTELAPDCTEQCTELDRMAAALTFSRIQHSKQLLSDRCWGSPGVAESDDLRLVRMESDRCPEIAVQLHLRRNEVLIDSMPINTPVAGQVFAPSCDPELLHRVRAHLDDKVEDAQAIAARNPSFRFKGRLVVIPDRSTPSGALDCLMSEAYAAGFTDPRIVVARPGRPFPLLLRTVSVHADPAMLPPAGVAVWSVRLSPSEVVLETPANDVLSAPSAGDLVPQARDLLSRLNGSPVLWVHRSDDLPLQDDLAARAALTAPGLFAEAWSLPLGGQSK